MDVRDKDVLVQTGAARFEISITLPLRTTFLFIPLDILTILDKIFCNITRINFTRLTYKGVE